MRDAVELERRDIPTVFITEDLFEAAARSLARSLGLPDLPMVVVPQPKPGMPRAHKEELVEKVLPQAVKGLTGRTAEAPGA